MKKKIFTSILFGLAASSAYAAIDEATQQAIRASCDRVKQEAAAAQARYVATFQPRQDPGKTFDDATAACLASISKFNMGFSFNIPSLGDVQRLLESAGAELLQRGCQSARDQFNREVQDAMAIVTGKTSIPGAVNPIQTDGATVSVNPTQTARDVINQTTNRATTGVGSIFR